VQADSLLYRAENRQLILTGDWGAKMAINYSIIRSHLESEKKRLAEQIEQLEASARALQDREGSPFGKREEGATEEQELEKVLALDKRAKEQLELVEHALLKFDSGNYGLCEICGLPIDLSRLDAIPQARLCMACKTKQEKGGKVRSA
jgi:DnaK suppressor protein